MIRPRTVPLPTSARRALHDQTGAALLLVLVLLGAIALVAAGAVALAGSAAAIHRGEQARRQLEPLAMAGIEWGRARIAADPTLVKRGVTTTLEENAPVKDAYGNAIPGVRRSTYVRPGGNTSGEYLPITYVLTVVEDGNGRRVMRRAELSQPSFARYAYFANSLTGVMISGDRFSGPVHFNDNLTIGADSGFFGGRLTVTGTISGRQYGVFGRDGVAEKASRVELPGTRDLGELEAIAHEAGYGFTSSSAGNAGEAILRIEFVWVDLDRDGVPEADEGFFKVYEAKNASRAEYVVASQKVKGSKEIIPLDSENCGDYVDGQFLAARHHVLPYTVLAGHVDGDLKHIGGDLESRLRSNDAAKHRCFLGGAKELTGYGTFSPDDGDGAWKLYPGPWVSGKPARLRSWEYLIEGDYLWPLSPRSNPNFKGVIHVKGKVAVSGVLRGRVTVAATENIIIADDVVYATDPGADVGCGEARRDMLGLFSGKDILVANNDLNAPRRVKDGASPFYTHWDDTADEHIDGVLLALNSHFVEEIGTGAGAATPGEPCQGTPFGRGCIFYNGGVIMKTVGAHEAGSRQGHLNRAAYDVCAAVNPPPYFPVTRQLILNKTIEEDPTNKPDSRRYLELLDRGH